ncbi:hypothetical protein D3C75_1082490 [compost metagenome]
MPLQIAGGNSVDCTGDNLHIRLLFVYRVDDQHTGLYRLTDPAVRHHATGGGLEGYGRPGHSPELRFTHRWFCRRRRSSLLYSDASSNDEPEFPVLGGSHLAFNNDVVLSLVQLI